MANTSHEISKYTLSEGVPWLVVYICEAVLILTGNSITVYISWSIRKRLKRTSYLLINLAVADALVGIAIVLFLWEAIAEILERNVNLGIVTTATMVDLIGTISSVLSMALISLERMLAILWPFRHRLLNACYYHVSIGFIWLVSALSMFSNLHLDPDTTKVDNAYSIFTTTTYISSVVIIVVAYAAIWISTRRTKYPATHTGRWNKAESSQRLFFWWQPCQLLLVCRTLSVLHFKTFCSICIHLGLKSP